MTLITKVGGGALVASSLAGLGVAGGRHFRKEDPNTIQQKTKISTLIADRYDYITLNTNESNKDWDDNWDAYKKDNSVNEKDVFGLDGWTKEDTQDLKEKLRERCSSLANESILESDNESYDNFAKYCTRGVTIKEKADKLGLTALSVDDNGRSDFEIWSKKRSDRKDALRKELEILKVTDGSNAYKIIERCKIVATTNKKNPEYTEEILDAYKRVCIKQSDE